jgi:hypothetical protein
MVACHLLTKTATTKSFATHQSATISATNFACGSLVQYYCIVKNWALQPTAAASNTFLFKEEFPIRKQSFHD